MTLSEAMIPCPQVPAPGWSTGDKELGRVDALLPVAVGCYVGGNFSEMQDAIGVHTRKWVGESIGGVVGSLGGAKVGGRVYGLALNLTGLHAVGVTGHWMHTAGGWVHVSTAPARSITSLGDGQLVIGEEDGIVRTDKWAVHTPGSARAIAVGPDAIYVAGAISNSAGAITKLGFDGTPKPWATKPSIPVLDICLSPDGTRVHVAEGGPGGTISTFDRSGRRLWFHMTDGNCQAICCLADGTVICGMHGDYVAKLPNYKIAEYGSGGRVPRKKVFALDPVSGALLGWAPDLSSSQGVLGVWSLAASAKTLYVGGDFTNVNGKVHSRLAAFPVLITPHLRYLRTVLRHKLYVYQAGRKLGVGRWQLIIHDLSKFSRAEWGPYVRRFETDAVVSELEWDNAWEHHWQNNQHHWQYWRPNDIPWDMPENYIREMVADWMGASRAYTGNSDCVDWYNQNKHRIVLTANTRMAVHRLLGFPT